MDTSPFFRFSVRSWLALTLGCLMVPVGLGQENKQKDSKQNRDEQTAQAVVLELNQLTGKDMLQAKLKWLLTHPAESKKVLAAALPLAKEKPGSINFNAALILARVARFQKDLPACETFYRFCMQDAIKMFSETQLFESYGGLSEAFFENRKFAESARVCKDILEFKAVDKGVYPVSRDPGTKEFFVPNEPIEDFDPALRLKSSTFFIRLFVLATARAGKATEAVELVDKLLDTNDQLWVLHQLRGQVLHTAGKYEEAIKSYDDALDRIAKDKKLTDQDRAELKEDCRYIESSIYIDMGKIDRATEILEKLLKDRPNHAGYLNDLGYILADSGQRLEEAEKMIRKAIDLEREKRQKNPDLTPDEDHDSGAYLDSLGWALFKQKKNKQAKEVMLKAVEDKATQHIEIYEHLGNVYEALGEHAAALAAWRKGVEVATDSRRDQERLAILRKKIDTPNK